MLRLAEIGLFLVPTALYVTWLIAGARTPRWAVWWAIGSTIAMAVGTIWFGLDNAIPADAGYEPAHVVNGEVVPGHAVPKKLHR